jgi:regulator of sigma E protease
VWKRIVVILAGPVMNLLIAFFIIWGLYEANGKATPVPVVDKTVRLQQPAAKVLKPGDRIVSVDGVTGGPDAFRAEIAKHKCAGVQKPGCVAATPVHLVVVRQGHRVAVTVRPRYDAATKRMLVGFAFSVASKNVGPVDAAHLAISDMWHVTTKTIGVVVRIFEPQQRKQLHSVVGSYKVTQQDFAHDTTSAVAILALISLSLAVVNLFPFLPLDGGHIFWALAEKVRGRPIAFSVMERASVVGFALVLLIFVIGLTNDVRDLGNGSLGVR